MEYSGEAVKPFLLDLVREALGSQADLSQTDLSLAFAQMRFVKSDPAIVTCTWPLKQGGRSRPFEVCFSGASIENFVAADTERLGRLRAAAVSQIRAAHQGFDPTDTGARYPFQCLVDRLGA
jgi:hypothetical protein